ncbi:hypothetical protein DM02DRAFT_701096 [Periconia macrospinosa]|uniref:S-adenosyl-L-methionine-dependent methyltransferase n=1 Tax=Periconia macrospinosa TaxID=97972 RepID=A0A2V1DWT6_9PLEO|nr:hypothetical protein DM02DRAFT_701096 [Periconia macrospinosa]
MAATGNQTQKKYPLEGEEEVDRLANQHEVIKDALNGALVVAPIDLLTTPLRILDSATADGPGLLHIGTWIRDLAASTAPIQHQFVGTDIDPTPFPTVAPPGQSYRAQDINKPWPEEWKDSFDLVHQRLALAVAGPAQQQVVNTLSALVKPGGWIQLIEATNVLPDEDGPAMHNLVKVIKGAFSAFGGSLELARELPGWLKEAGLGRQGVHATTVAAKGLSEFAKTLPAGTVDLPAEKIESLSDDLKQELMEIGGHYPLVVVWARKPAAI